MVKDFFAFAILKLLPKLAHYTEEREAILQAGIHLIVMELESLAISVIIPALNEAENIRPCLDSITGQPGPLEIIVADGGSSDDTAALAQGYARVISAPRGRASQMNAAARLAAGDVLLFLHADTRLHPRGLSAIRQTLADKTAAGGTFHLSFDTSAPLFRVYAGFTHLHWLYLHYGDQGIFIRRAVFERLGGYRDIALMEDIDLLRRMQALGRRAVLPFPVTTSARRFYRDGLVRNQVKNIFLVLLFALGADPDRLAAWYRPHKG